LRHYSLDHFDAGIEFSDEPKAHRLKAFGERITHHGVSFTRETHLEKEP
jgi:hypothetical protein